MAQTPDFEAEGLLDGLDDEAARSARLGLLRELHEEGIGLEELRQAAAEERLALLPVEQALGGGGRYTFDELVERTGASADWLLRVGQALGRPQPGGDERTFTDADIEAATRLGQLRDAGFPEGAILDLVRVMAQSTARVADALRITWAESLMQPGDNERDVAHRLAGATRALRPQLGASLEYMTDLHLRQQLRVDFLSHAELEAGRPLPGAREVTIAFADLVGFTRLGASVEADELGDVAGRLTALVGDVVQPPVRVVKMIGDAAMLVAYEAPAMLDAVLDLVETAGDGDDGLPPLRAGVAAGPALQRGGDWYGHTVNLASRLTGVARPGSVLVSESVRDAAGDEAYRWSFAGERRLKGMERPVRQFRLRRPVT